MHMKWGLFIFQFSCGRQPADGVLTLPRVQLREHVVRVWKGQSLMYSSIKGIWSFGKCYRPRFHKLHKYLRGHALFECSQVRKELKSSSRPVGPLHVRKNIWETMKNLIKNPADIAKCKMMKEMWGNMKNQTHFGQGGEATFAFRWGNCGVDFNLQSRPCFSESYDLWMMFLQMLKIILQDIWFLTLCLCVFFQGWSFGASCPNFWAYTRGFEKPQV